jgi:FkbM family methyltransferase
VSLQKLKRFVHNPGPYFTKLKYYLAGVYFDCVQKRYRFRDCSFDVPVEYTGRVDRGHFALGTYEKAECDVIVKVVNEDCAVLELGGCIGVVSCVTNRLLRGSSRHVVVEANPHLIPYITRNRDRNGCQFKIENCVITFQPDVEFFVGETMMLGSICRKSGPPIRVKGLTVSELELRHCVSFDTVIMDIEGGEYDLIRENGDFFSRMRNVILENHPEVVGRSRIVEYESLLIAAGFKRTFDVGQVTAWQKVTSL